MLISLSEFKTFLGINQESPRLDLVLTPQQTEDALSKANDSIRLYLMRDQHLADILPTPSS